MFCSAAGAKKKTSAHELIPKQNKAVGCENFHDSIQNSGVVK